MERETPSGSGAFLGTTPRTCRGESHGYTAPDAPPANRQARRGGPGLHVFVRWWIRPLVGVGRHPPPVGDVGGGSRNGAASGRQATLLPCPFARREPGDRRVS